MWFFQWMQRIPSKEQMSNVEVMGKKKETDTSNKEETIKISETTNISKLIYQNHWFLKLNINSKRYQEIHYLLSFVNWIPCEKINKKNIKIKCLGFWF